MHELGFQKDCTRPMGVRQRILQEGGETLVVRDPSEKNRSASTRDHESPSPPFTFSTRSQR